MKKQTLIESVVTWIRLQSPSRIKQLTWAIIAVVGLLTVIIFWQIASHKGALRAKSSAAQRTLKEAIALTIRNAQLNAKEAAYAKAITESPSRGIIDSTMALLSAAQANPQPGWQETRAILEIPDNATAVEERVNLHFEGQNTEQLTTLLEVIRKEPSIAIREIEIKHNGMLLSSSLVVGTRTMKIGAEERGR